MKESIVDIERTTLDPQIFDLSKTVITLLPIVRLQILKQAQRYSEWVLINRVLMIGSLLTKQWTEESDCDITLIVEQEDENKFDSAKKFSISQEGKNFIEGTLHPINCFVRRNWDESYSDQIYDVLENKLIKQSDATPIDIDNYLDMFSKYVAQIDLLKGELNRDLIDYNELIKFDVNSIKGLQSRVQEKLKEIDSDVKELVASYKTIHALRKIVFSSDLSPEELKTYKVRGAMPANVVYKLLEHYHYAKFLRALTSALNLSGGAIKNLKDVQNIIDVEKMIDKEVENV